MDGKKWIAITEVEWYPVYSINLVGPGDNRGAIHEIDETTWQRWEATFQAFDDIQTEIKEMRDAAEARRKSKIPFV